MYTDKLMKKGFLILEDKTIVKGIGLGAEKIVYGELVFNTAMSGYEESFTDPSYAGQILLMTYPLIGNYGFNTKYKQSNSVKIRGLVVKEPAFFSSRNCRMIEYLLQNDLPCLWNVDTRRLTLKLRYFGTMKAMLVVTSRHVNPVLLSKRLLKTPHPHRKNLVAKVSCKKIIIHRSHNNRRVVLIDCGVKKNIIKNLQRYFTVVQVPYNTDLGTIKRLKPSGIVISNGPGNPEHPAVVNSTVRVIRELIKMGYPVFGICLGHQILGLALGLKTYKMKFGHRGYNHPVKCLENKRIYITSQNHGYALKMDGTNKNSIIDWINLNDGTIEGLHHRSHPVFSVQFHPEASPGPNDTLFLFEKFSKIIDARSQRY